jgi:hypothetical protein
LQCPGSVQRSRLSPPIIFLVIGMVRDTPNNQVSSTRRTMKQTIFVECLRKTIRFRL